MSESVYPERKSSYTPAEFAALFGKERSWTYRRLGEGKVLAITDYGWIRIPDSERERILNDKGRYLGRKRRKKGGTES